MTPRFSELEVDPDRHEIIVSGKAMKLTDTERKRLLLLCNNPIERCWGILQTHWSGTLVDKVSQTGVRLTKAALKPFEQPLCRSTTRSKWNVST